MSVRVITGQSLRVVVLYECAGATECVRVDDCRRKGPDITSITITIGPEHFLEREIVGRSRQYGRRVQLGSAET